MDRCFVIQPFDNDRFDSLFKDVFEPAISKTGLEAYRIDRDLSTRIPIDDIEKGIRESILCFAEVTSDNPNVWYELGYAFACNRDVVLVCSDERQGKFPFDIRHRHIVTYKTNSKSDFVNLEETITKKIQALQQTKKTVKSLNDSPIVETEGLQSHEIVILILLIENQISDDDSTSVHTLKIAMGSAGYTDVATSVGIRTLSKKGMLEVFREKSDWNDVEGYNVCRLTALGEQWVLQNQDQLVLRKNKNTR